jgi:hypothetical protein
VIQRARSRELSKNPPQAEALNEEMSPRGTFVIARHLCR